MQQRLDLDGITLTAPGGGPTVAVLRYRTTEGLVVRLPESTDLVVPWDAVDDATIDLAAGEVRVTFTEAFTARSNWLSGVRTLTGQWTDRATLGSRQAG